MSTRIRLVSGDTRPPIVVSVRSSANETIDCTGAVVELLFRPERGTLLRTIPGVLLAGILTPAGAIDASPPYNTPGSGGVMQFNWPAGALNVQPGNYEGEVQITFPDASVQSVYDPIKFTIRQGF